MSKLLNRSTPRNPLVRAARFRLAGRHDVSVKALRQSAQAALRRELHRAEAERRSP